jgi:hypothetical protein
MHKFTFRIEQITGHLDGQKVLTLTELPTRIGAKFHPDPLHRMASIQISTFGGDLNQYQLGQIVEMKMSILSSNGPDPDSQKIWLVSDSSETKTATWADQITDAQRELVEDQCDGAGIRHDLQTSS